MVALRAGCSKRVRILAETVPVLRVIFPRLIGREAVPHPRVDLGHLRLLDNFDVERGAGDFGDRSGVSRAWKGGFWGGYAVFR